MFTFVVEKNYFGNKNNNDIFICIIQILFLPLHQVKQKNKSIMENTTMSARQRLYELCSKYGVNKALPCQIQIGHRTFVAPHIAKLVNRFDYAVSLQLVMTEINVDGSIIGNTTQISENEANAFLNKLLSDKKFIGRCMEKLVHKRFSMESLCHELEVIFGGKPHLPYIDDGISCDHRLGFDNKYGDFDIWFLRMYRRGSNGESMYITEVGYTLN